MSEHALESVAFPKLKAEQIAALQGCARASVRRCADGEVLVSSGDRRFKFYVVKSGQIAVVDDSGDTPKTIVVHGPGAFTGEVSQLTGQPAIASLVTRGETEVLEISGDALREVLNQCPDLSDIVLQAYIARRQMLHESSAFAGLRVIGSRFSKDTFRLRDFLARNRVLFTFLDLETDPDVAHVLERFGVTPADTPIVFWGTKLFLRNPSNRELADVLGIRQTPEHTVYDLAVVGGGPGGLAAAVYGASEGLATVILERTAPGGQAAASMRIENYLGFPTGVTGSDLANRAVLQANKFGALLSVPSRVAGLTFDGAYCVLALEGGETVVAKCLLIATGADYRKLGVEGCDRFEDSGVYYAATFNETQVCRGADVLVVGGGNSAGQAAVFLSGYARKVFLIVRANDLNKNMSAYLARRIEQTPNIEIHLETTVERMSGDVSLKRVDLLNRKTGEEWSLETPALFSFIGAVPHTDWLPPEIERDEKQFVRTGPVLAQSSRWTPKRQPFLLETSRPGVFAAGDVRSGSVKRVASAVGEGSMAVQFVHEYLKTM